MNNGIIVHHITKVFIFEEGVSTSAMEHCRKMKFRIQHHLTLISSLFNYCHASVTLDYVDVS